MGCQTVNFRTHTNVHSKVKIIFICSYRWISIWWISVTQMTNFAGKYFNFNLHLKRVKFGLFAKPYVSNKKLILTRSNQKLFWFWKQPPEVFLKKVSLKMSFYTPMNFTGKYLCFSLFLINFIKKRLLIQDTLNTRTSVNNWLLLWFETWHTTIQQYLCLLFYVIPQQILKFPWKSWQGV